MSNFVCKTISRDFLYNTVLDGPWQVYDRVRVHKENDEVVTVHEHGVINLKTKKHRKTGAGCAPGTKSNSVHPFDRALEIAHEKNKVYKDGLKSLGYNSSLCRKIIKASLSEIETDAGVVELMQDNRSRRRLQEINRVVSELRKYLDVVDLQEWRENGVYSSVSVENFSTEEK